MEITVAKSAGFCFGVQRAVDSVYKELEENWEQIGGKFDENLKNLFKSV